MAKRFYIAPRAKNITLNTARTDAMEEAGFSNAVIQGLKIWK